jgi:type I restriction enzyme S subunit
VTADVPSGWTTVRLGEIGETLIGLTYEPSSVQRSGTLVLRSSNVQGGSLSFSDNVYVDCPIPDRIRVRDKDILVCVRNGSRKLIGKSVMLDTRVVGETFGAFMAVFRSNANPYLRYFFESDDFKRQVDGHLGATINQITNGSLKSFSVTLPDLREQREIVERLGDADHLIAALERLIAKKQAIKQGMMQQLLAGLTRIPGFTEPWSRSPIREIVSTPVTDGPHSTPEFLSDGIPFLSVNNLVGGRIDWSDLRYISRDDHEAFSRKCRPRRGDVLLGKAASVGKVAFLDSGREVNIWSPIALIRTDPRHDSRFVYYQLQSRSTTRQIDLLTNSSSQGNIGMGDIEKIVLDLPPRPEQLAIAATLADADADSAACERQLVKVRSVARGMLQQLLTGRTRLSAADAMA